MRVVALAGGVGGAKLADGLARVLPPGDLTVVVNTGDDFDHFDLRICPDLDTVCYTLAGIANPETGWGQKDESWQALQSITHLGGPGWFRIGDRDLGTHLERTRRLRSGQRLSQITAAFCRSWGISSQVLPMTDDRVSTIVQTVEMGDLPFQNYFVEYQCRPVVTGFRFAGIEDARPAPGAREAIETADLIVICPSNPWVSISPILHVPGLRQIIETKLVVAVSPIIHGKAVKGPAAKMYAELGLEPSALTVARHYGALLAGFVLDRTDASLEELIHQSGIIPYATNTLMVTSEDRYRLAQEVVGFGEIEKRRKSET